MTPRNNLLIAMIIIVLAITIAVHLAPPYNPPNRLKQFEVGTRLELNACRHMLGAPDNLEIYSCALGWGWAYIQCEDSIIIYLSYNLPKGTVSVGDLVAWYGEDVPDYFTWNEGKGLFAWVRGVYFK